MTGREIAEHLERIATAARNNDAEGLRVGRAMLGAKDLLVALKVVTSALARKERLHVNVVYGLMGGEWVPGYSPIRKPDELELARAAIAATKEPAP